MPFDSVTDFSNSFKSFIVSVASFNLKSIFSRSIYFYVFLHLLLRLLLQVVINGAKTFSFFNEFWNSFLRPSYYQKLILNVVWKNHVVTIIKYHPTESFELNLNLYMQIIVKHFHRKSFKITFNHVTTFIINQIIVVNLRFFFYLGFLSQPFMNHRTVGEGRGHFLSSSLPFPNT